MKLSDAFIGKRLFVGCPNKAGVYVEPVALGVGPLEIRGSSYIEGPVQIGDPTSYTIPEAGLMVGRCQNVEAGYPATPISIVKISSRANKPNPFDVVIGDIVGPVGIAVHALVINTLVDTFHNYVCPQTNIVGIINHVGMENLTGAKTLTGAEIIAALKAQFGAEVRTGLKNTIGHTHLTGSVTVAGPVTAPWFLGNINKQGWKGFDIEHPTKKGKRVRHICVEGPEAAIYIRGHLKDTNTIDLPEYWNGLVDPETITVSLTAFGRPQSLYVDSIPYGRKVIIKNEDGSQPNCHYDIWAHRIGAPLHVVYDGESPSDYPGDQSTHSIAGYHYDRREK